MEAALCWLFHPLAQNGSQMLLVRLLTTSAACVHAGRATVCLERKFPPPLEALSVAAGSEYR